MKFNEKIYSVVVDGFFAGLAESEEEIADIAADCTNGISRPLYDDDIPDRVWWDVIHINNENIKEERQAAKERATNL